MKPLPIKSLSIKPMSAFSQTILSLVITAGLVLAITFAIILNTPTPEPRLFSMQDLVNGLKDAEAAQRLNLKRTVSNAPAFESSGHLFERLIAQELETDAADVALSRQPGQSTSLTLPTSLAVLKQTDRPVISFETSITFDLADSTRQKLADAVVSALSAQKFISGKASYKRADGRWVTVKAIDPFWTGWRRQIVLSFGLSVLVLLPVGWWVARGLSQPLRDMEALADRVQIDAKLPEPSVKGPSEVVGVTKALHRMHKRLQSQALERTRMVAAIAHDLRTPLTSLRVRTENAQEKQRPKMVSDIVRMEAMIREMLEFAGGADIKQSPRSFILSDVLQLCIEDGRLHGKIEVHGPLPPLQMTGFPQALRRAVSNLIENAQKYATSAELSVKALPETVQIRISDDGPGLPQEDLERLISPFERSENSRNRDTGGSGLGLAIAHEVAKRHGGSLHLENRETGGLRAALEIPRALIQTRQFSDTRTR